MQCSLCQYYSTLFYDYTTPTVLRRRLQNVECVPRKPGMPRFSGLPL